MDNNLEYNMNQMNVSNSYLNGYLQILIGPMYAGKTTNLINQYKLFLKQNKKTIILTHSIDIRYSVENLSSHDKDMIKCLKYDSISDFINNNIENIKHSECILIDEAQFFPDLMNILSIVEEYKKIVFVYGLDGDFKRNKFGNILDLIPYCDTITKLHAKCNVCNDCALFSHRKLKNDDQVLVGSNDAYESLCRNCYLKHKS